MLRSLIQATENWHEAIEDASVEVPTWFNMMVPRGTAELGQGYERQKWRFHGDIVDQAGMTSWREVQRGRAAGTGYTKYDGTVVPPSQDPGLDPCSYDADIINYGFEPETYHAWERYLRSNNVCVNQVKFDWEFTQQMDQIFKSLAENTLQVWENAFQEYFMKLAADSGRMFVLGGGTPTKFTATYDPFISTTITCAAPPPTYSAFNWKPFPYFHNLLELQARSSSSTLLNGRPAWPLIVDGDDWQDWLDSENSVREDLRYANPSVNLEGWGSSLAQYRGYPIVHRYLMPRYTLVPGANGAATFVRVTPYDSASVYIGNKRVLSEDYLNAEFGVAFIYPKDTFRALIPPTISTAGGGTRFDTQPSLAGEAYWINNKDNETNILGEKGYYFLRFQSFMEPLRWFDQPIVIIYKRCTGKPARVCEPCGSDVGTGAINIVASSAENVNGTSADYTVRVTLESCLPCETGDIVTVNYGGSQEVGNAVIVKSGDAPIYDIYMQSSANWATLLATGATVTCGESA
jgi:hypothetical protein